VSSGQKRLDKTKRKRRAKAQARVPPAARAGKAGKRVPASGNGSAGARFEKLVALQAQLRAPGGCPWDREQTHESLGRYLVEETYEVLDAIETGDSREFASELGDLLLQVVFHATLAEEAGRFTIADVIESIHTKMVRRHPHVFGDVEAPTSAAVLKNWERIKAEERAENGKASRRKSADESILAEVPRSLPGVLEAYQLTRRAARIGFDWDNIEGIFDKIEEEKHELLEIRPAGPDSTGSSRSVRDEASTNSRLEEETGDLLFAAVNVARFLGVDPEIALKRANRKFKERFTAMEEAARREGRRLADLPRARMEELWNESKSLESKSAKTKGGRNVR
jgi:nucleoside triphosphate diphosphatase